MAINLIENVNWILPLIQIYIINMKTRVTWSYLAIKIQGCTFDYYQLWLLAKVKYYLPL